MRGRALILAFAVLASIWGCLAWRAGSLPWARAFDIPSESIEVDGGAFAAPVPEPGSGLAHLLEGRGEPDRPLGALSGAFGWSRTYHYLDGLIGARFPALTTRLTWTPIAAASPTREGKVRFASSDGSDARVNGRQYRLESERRVPRAVIAALGLAALAAGVAAIVSSWRSPGGLVRAHFPGILISIVMLGFIALAAEVALSSRIQFVERQWPARVDPLGGFIFLPGEEVRHTNHVEFGNGQKINSLGFPDREPAMPKPPGTFRILVLGDSFVEALQVPIAIKFHVLLEQALREALPARKIDVVAMGYSGTGQASQLAFYEMYGRKLAPDLVINLATWNDFANNSPVLEAVRHGWDPRHAPRLSFEIDPKSGQIRRDEVDLGWEKHVLHPATGDPTRDMQVRLGILRRNPDYKPLLDGWRYPSDLDMDEMFCADDMPLAFRQAETLTAHVFGRLAAASRADNARMLVVAAENMTTLCGARAEGRRVRSTALVERLGRAAAASGLDVVDLYPVFARNGDVKQARYRIDVHWNETGHQWAARAIAEHLVRNPGLLSPS